MEFIEDVGKGDSLHTPHGTAWWWWVPYNWAQSNGPFSLGMSLWHLAYLQLGTSSPALLIFLPDVIKH